MKVALFIPCYVDAFFPGGRHRHARAARAPRLRGRLSARPDLLRPADGQQRLPRRRARHRGAVRAELRRLRLHRHAVGQLRPPRARPPDRDRADRRRCRRCAATPTSWSSSCTTCSRCASSRGPSSRTRSACTSAARRCAALREAKTSEIDEPAFTKPARLLSAVKGIEFVHAAAAGRMLRLRRHVLGLRGAGVGQDGLRQGQRPPARPAPSTSSRPTCRA